MEQLHTWEHGMPRNTTPLIRSEKYKKPRRLCVIGTEDSKTGAWLYFENFRHKLHETYSFALEIIPTVDGKSSPNHVLGNIIPHGFRKDTDSCWIACDLDRWPSEMLSDVAAVCAQKNIGCIFSNPCSEFWILLHQPVFAETFNNSKECKAAGEAFIKANGYDVILSNENIRHAIRQAKALDSANWRWPEVHGSHAYKLVEYLLSTHLSILTPQS